ncbi:MAG: peptidoglycan-binding protein [Gammaproteobacteria bacterium]|nr:peptidoglycan-binding protein [Gammaproteobacteria bacterium]
MTEVDPRVKAIIDAIIKAEGLYVNDSSDLGGATKYGITAKTLGHWLKLGRKATPEEVKDLTHEMAFEIYLKQYYFRPNIDEAPIELQPSLLDMYVNSGSNAVKILQRLINRMEGSPVLKCDGILGHGTLSHVEEWYLKDVPKFIDAYGLSRVNYYIRIAKVRKVVVVREGVPVATYPNRKFLWGWVRRTNKYISPGRRLAKQSIVNILDRWKREGV